MSVLDFAIKIFTDQALPARQKITLTNGALVALSNEPLKAKAMKRIGNLFEKVISIDNLLIAERNARRGKLKQAGVIQFDKNRDSNIAYLYKLLVSKTYRTSDYLFFKIYEPKEREIARLPYFPDRIMHHAIMNVLEPLFVSCFTSDTYNCIKNRGIHLMFKRLKLAMRDADGTKFCLKLDIKKFYQNIDHDILKFLLRRKIKDDEMLWLLDEIIDSASGLPIGNYLSQYFANFYLSWFDHWIKEQMGVKYYFRYADDIVILSNDKRFLQALIHSIISYLHDSLKLTVKDNYQVFPVESRGVDVIGYKFFHTHILLRKSTKQSFARKVAKGISQSSMASYVGWTKHCNSRHLLKKLTNEIIQRPKHFNKDPVCRSKGRNLQRIQQGDCNKRLQNRALQV